MASIYLLGNSPTFIAAAQSVYPGMQIHVLSWRDCLSDVNKMNASSPEILLVCGYDYKSSQYQFQDYYDTNVNTPFQAIQLISGINTTVIYINTIVTSSQLTFSRYLFAKNHLGYLLQCNFSKFINIPIPTVIDQNGRPLIHGGLFTKLIFSILIKFKVIKVLKKEALIEKLLNLKSMKKSDISIIRGKFLVVKRSLFVDRLLRIFCG